MRAHTSVTEARDVRVTVRYATLNNRLRLIHINVKMLLKSLYLCNGIHSTAILNASGSCVVYILYQKSAAFFRAENEGRTTVVGVTSTRKQ
jgi:hypothetical protein